MFPYKNAILTLSFIFFIFLRLIPSTSYSSVAISTLFLVTLSDSNGCNTDSPFHLPYLSLSSYFLFFHCYFPSFPRQAIRLERFLTKMQYWFSFPSSCISSSSYFLFFHCYFHSFPRSRSSSFSTLLVLLSHSYTSLCLLVLFFFLILTPAFIHFNYKLYTWKQRTQDTRAHKLMRCKRVKHDKAPTLQLSNILRRWAAVKVSASV